jgi:hypothetical protein
MLSTIRSVLMPLYAAHQIHFPLAFNKTSLNKKIQQS